MNNYRQNREFLASHMELVELTAGDSRILVTPTLQGRVLCSSADGEDGESFGWLNYDLIASGEVLPHVNNYGGEDRFWIGPEGGQYAFYFDKRRSEGFDFDFWQVPPFIDTEGWKQVSASDSKASFERSEKVCNYQGAEFDCDFSREVEILSLSEISQLLGVEIEGVKSVGFTSHNTIKNVGSEPWNEERGAMSVWILGQFNPSEQNHLIIPVRGGESATIKGDYFGEIPEDRLFREGDTYYFKADGKMRGKIGTPHASTKPIVFALDEEAGLLTIVKFSFSESESRYASAAWRYQDEPYKGDVINGYNDGPLEDGTIMGGFYEIESSSCALFLGAGESHTHTHTTIHIKGDLSALRELIQKLK